MSTDRSGESAYIEWLRQRTPPAARVLVGPGDDAAVLKPPDRSLLVTTDMLLDGTCFRLGEAGAFRVGRKAINVNLSDIAAMAGVPTAAVVSVGLPRTGGPELAEQLYLGMRDAADAFQVPLVGGDTNSWDGPLTISVTVLGEATARGPVLRSGAKIGDWIMVIGPLGGSILGHHLDFTPRVREARHDRPERWTGEGPASPLQGESLRCSAVRRFHSHIRRGARALGPRRPAAAGSRLVRRGGL
jgi:thiamine-monophosphate kinase